MNIKCEGMILNFEHDNIFLNDKHICRKMTWPDSYSVDKQEIVV